MNKKSIKINSKNIAFCGLYCEACRKFISGGCPGCNLNEKATWCGVRSCCLENGYRSCADCKSFSDPHDCKKFHNPISRVIGFLFRSDRRKCIEYVKSEGYDKYAAYMAESGRMSMRR